MSTNRGNTVYAIAIGIGMLINVVVTIMAMTASHNAALSAANVQAIDDRAIAAVKSDIKPELLDHNAEIKALSNAQQDFINDLTTSVANDMKDTQKILKEQNQEMLKALEGHVARIERLEKRVQELYAKLEN